MSLSTGSPFTVQVPVILNTGGTFNATSGNISFIGATVTEGTLIDGTGTISLSDATLDSVALTGNGVIDAIEAVLDGDAAIQNSTTVVAGNGDQLTLRGAITNTGDISVDATSSTGPAAVLGVDGNVTLSGAGAVIMSNNPNNIIEGTTGTDILTNNSTIEGSGNIGNSLMGLTNHGIISANQGYPLIVQAAPAETFSNTGTVSVSTGSTLEIIGPFANFNAATGSLTGGIFDVAGTLQFNNANIVTNGANITLSGAIVNQNGVRALADLANNASSGSLTVAENLTLPSPMANAGKMVISKSYTLTLSGATPAYN
jgi:hypothetical protein